MLELEQAKKRAAELRALIEYNNRLYYDQDAPELEDFQYDALTRELRELETAYPELVTPDSPTQHVGGTPSGRFAKVTHAVKMESLLDAFSYENCGTSTGVSGMPGWSRSTWWRSKSTACPAAWNMRMANWCGPPPAETAWWART